jgi:glycosyltransferase involved in cell wall biosynthesis
MLVSICIPVYNEEENIERLYAELCEVASRAKMNCEFVLVDDGSTDRSVEKLKEIAAEDSRIVLVELRRNFGQTAAMAAGFDYANGEVIVTLDGDLQNDPHEIPKMIAKLQEGYDLVAGWRKDRKDKMISRRIPSMIANRLISKITKVKLHDYGCTLKVFKADVAKNLDLYGELHRFIPALAAQRGAKIAEVPVNHRPRLFGQSKYGISRTFRVLLDLLTVFFFMCFSTKPLHMFGALGATSGFIGGTWLGVSIIQRLFFAVPMGGRPSVLLGVMLVLIGLQFLCFGLLAEILVRTYHESQNKKIYNVRNVWRGDSRITEPEKRAKIVGIA